MSGEVTPLSRPTPRLLPWYAPRAVRWQWAMLAVILAVALGARIYPARQAVFGGSEVNFLETDSWYHIRLVEHQVRNYPWRVTVDPYAAPGGQFVAIAPLFDTLTASIVFLGHGRGATTRQMESIAAFVPPVMGTLTVLAIFAVVRSMTGVRGALVAAALAAVLPGHFLDRTMLGFVDHHALESLLAVLTLLVLVRATRTPPAHAAALVGLTLGAYLLSWSGGAFLLAVVGVWLLIATALMRDADEGATLAATIARGAAIALLVIILFQDPRMHRYGSQVAGLLALGALGVASWWVLRRVLSRTTTGAGHGQPHDAARPSAAKPTVVLAAIVIVTAAAISLGPSDLLRQIWTDVRRLAPDPSRMGVLEARPLFLYTGEWSWLQPWQFFRTGFYVGLTGLVLLTARLFQRRDHREMLLWTYGAGTLIATVGQNRFGYYLVTACALIGGWAAEELLAFADRSGREQRARPVTLLREGVLIGITVAVFVPILLPSVLLAARASSFAPYWQDAMHWLRTETPPPFARAARTGDEYYFAPYHDAEPPSPDYTVMNWWDQGYWVVQRGRRVPVSNPTQARASNAARFYVSTTEAQAVAIADQERSRFVLSDWELPYRLNEGRVMGRFQSVLEWAGAEHRPYYEVYYRRESGAWIPQWVFHAAYYHSMAFRLTVLGGEAAAPSNATSVITVAERTDPNGLAFREVLTSRTFATFDEALLAAAKSSDAALVVGLDPWRAAFPVAALARFRLRYDARTPEQQPAETPWVRVFERTDDAPRAAATSDMPACSR